MKADRILIPTDFSPQSHAALKLAKTFIDIYGCDVSLIHIVPLSMYFGESFEHLGLPLDLNVDVYPRILENTQERLDELAKEYIPKEYLEKAKVMVDRKPSEAIARYAKENDYDLILMSSKGGHESEWFRGSITKKVIRYSKVPVLTVDDVFVKEKLENIVSPVDLSDTSMKALPAAFELAYQFDAKLTLLHVSELYAHDGFGNLAPIPGMDEPTAYEAIMDKIEAFFADHFEGKYRLQRTGTPYEDRIVYTEGNNNKSIPIETEVLRGISAHHEITEYANEHADLLVLTTHGRTGLAHFFLGSTAGNIVEHAQVPVLTIRPDNLGAKSKKEKEE